jgi:undecaprenyl-diphosphatase
MVHAWHFPALDILQAIILGLIQGLTEWLPVSSSGHLALAQRWMDTTPVAFDIMLHLGTTIVLMFYFRDDISKGLSAAGGAFSAAARKGGGFRGLRRAINEDERRKTTWFVLFGILPTACIGLIFEIYLVDWMYADMRFVGAMFLLTGIILLSTKGLKGKKGILALDTRHAYLIGLAQGFSTAPGLSRSGATVSAAMHTGLRRGEAARIAFLMGIPALLGVSFYHLIVDFGTITGEGWPLFVVGTVTAMVVGYLTLSWLMRMIRKGDFWAFAPYCIMLGAAALVLGLTA